MDPFEGLEDIVKRRKLEASDKRSPAQIRQDEKKELKAEIKAEKKQKRLGDALRVVTRAPPRKKQKSGAKLKKRTEDARKAVLLLTEYGKNEWLGPYLQDSHGFELAPVKLRRMTNSKLVDLVEEVESVLANKTNSAIGDGAVRGAMYQLEMLAESKSRFRIGGATDRCFENDHWRFLLERVKLQYGIGFGHMDPITELTFVTIQTAAMMHYSNSLQEPTTNLDEEFEEEVLEVQ